MHTLLVVEGTWQPYPWGMCGNVITQLNDEWRALRIPYPESFGDGYSYSESYTIAMNNLLLAIDNLQGPFSILGYSQGAAAVGNVGAACHNMPNLLNIYCIADPMRSEEDTLIGPAVVGHGIGGSRTIGPKAFQFAAPGDFISACNNNFLANVARYTYSKSDSSWKQWFKEFNSAAKQRESGGSFKQALKELKYYLKYQPHINYHNYEVEAGVTATRWIADHLNARLQHQ